jgi:hypothetical protein
MATFLLQERHQREQQQANTPPPISTPSTPAGDHRYRIPTIGLNPGHLPGTRPEHAILAQCYNQPQHG